jgi:tRNA U34 2-thiouridine synthase MnmA/TrmU
MKTIGEKITFSYTDKQRGIAQWQTLTAYIGDECIGSGTIINT